MDKNYYEEIKNNLLIKKENLFRFGSIGDGGYYLSPAKMLEADILFSGGISSNIEFEYDLFRFNKDLKIFMVDPTVSSSKLLVKAVLRMFLFKENKLRYLFNTLIFIYLIRSERCWHFKKWLSEKNNILDLIHSRITNYKDKTILLKLDIEGSEYHLLDEILKNLKLFNCMIFEFHHLDTHHQFVYDFISNCSEDFDLVHIEINPSGGFDNFNRPKNIELTLERRN